MIKQALENLKINALNEIQQAALSAAKKSDIVLLAPTGSGKTLGFLLPLLGLLDTNIRTGLLAKKGGLAKDEIGLIEVLDYSSYVAVKRSLIEKTVQLLKSEKIKNKKVKIEVSI